MSFNNPFFNKTDNLDLSGLLLFVKSLIENKNLPSIEPLTNNNPDKSSSIKPEHVEIILFLIDSDPKQKGYWSEDSEYMKKSQDLQYKTENQYILKYIDFLESFNNLNNLWIQYFLYIFKARLKKYDVAEVHKKWAISLGHLCLIVSEESNNQNALKKIWEEHNYIAALYYLKISLNKCPPFKDKKKNMEKFVCGFWRNLRNCKITIRVYMLYIFMKNMLMQFILESLTLQWIFHT
jgi:hypothetical protein